MTFTTAEAMEEERPKKRTRSSKQFQIPTVFRTDDDAAAPEEFAKAWETFQVVFLPAGRNCSEEEPSQQQPGASAKGTAKTTPSAEITTTFTWKDIHELFGNLSDRDQKSFCIETSGDDVSSNTSSKQKNSSEQSPQSFFQSPATTDSLTAVGSTSATTTGSPIPQLLLLPYYCSFLVQNDKVALQNLLSRVPVPTLHHGISPLQQQQQQPWRHEPCVWIFFGRNPPHHHSAGDHDPENDSNPSSQDLQGRPEHTDSISHDGTWHYQLSGIKRWRLRPTAKLLEQWKERGTAGWTEEWADDYHITVDCRQGDIVVINTRLWFHQTVLPPQPDPSVSYARDFWNHTTTCGSTTQQQQTQPPSDDILDPQQQQQSRPDDDSTSSTSNSEGGCMTNVDGLYATNDIEVGTIIFREQDMPDCELHRSKDNNCEVVELENGTGAVVSSRDIVAGEFFCLAESDDDEDDDVYDEDDDDDEEDL